jgi:hypothetical protein
MWNEAYHEKITDAGVVHLPENNSDHCLVYCVVDIGDIQSEDNPPSKPSPPKPSWKKASSEQKSEFHSNLELNASTITIPESLSNCWDVHCNNPGHNEDANNGIIEVLKCVEKAACENLPVPQPPKAKKPSNNIPGWSEEVHPNRENARFWNQIWLSAGRPINTQLH